MLYRASGARGVYMCSKNSSFVECCVVIMLRLASSRLCCISISPLRASTACAPSYRTPCYRDASPLSVNSSTAAASFDNDPTLYKQHRKDRQKVLHAKLTSPNRYQPITAREDRSEWPTVMTKVVGLGRWLTVYRGCDLMKSPEDLVIRHQLFWYLKPATVIELGTYTGGMAIWMADTVKLLDVPCQIYSMDIDLSLLEDRVKELKQDNVTFLQGDCYAIEKTFTPEFMSQLPHPWIVIEDAHENMKTVLGHFHKFMQQGDYLIVEDTNPHMGRWISMDGSYEEAVGPGKLNDLSGFLEQYGDHYAVDSFYTDLYGYNGSWFWNGYIKRMK